MTVAILIFIGAVTLGFWEGRSGSRVLVVVVSGIAIMGVSNLAANWQWFGSDPSTWARTYGTGLLQIGVRLALMHLVPFFTAFLIGGRSRSYSKFGEE